MPESEMMFGLLAAAITVACTAPYFVGIARGLARPHCFTWLLWTLTMSIVAAAQFSDGAGPGAWPMLTGALLTFAIFLLSLKRGEKHITRSDWVMLTLGLAAIPLWVATKDPLWSVILVVGIDTVAYVPTVRKSWRKPQEEVALTYALSMLWQGLSLLAMDNVTLVTVFAPASYVLVNGLFVTYLFARRYALTGDMTGRLR